MPDKNGGRTIRDTYPISCGACGRVILTAVYDLDGNVVYEAEGYRAVRLVETGGSYVSVYHHTEDCSTTGYVQARQKRLATARRIEKEREKRKT